MLAEIKPRAVEMYNQLMSEDDEHRPELLEILLLKFLMDYEAHRVEEVGRCIGMFGERS